MKQDAEARGASQGYGIYDGFPVRKDSCIVPYGKIVRTDANEMLLRYNAFKRRVYKRCAIF